MSATHILTVTGAIRCGQKQIRGFITPEQYTKISNSGPLPERIYTRVNHTCSYREGGKCFIFAGGRKVEHFCPRQKRTVVGICSGCRNRSSYREE